MTAEQYDAACEFIRASDIARELLSAGKDISVSTWQALDDARHALDVLLTPPKPAYTPTSEPKIIPHSRQGRQLAPPARPRPYIVDAASVTR